MTVTYRFSIEVLHVNQWNFGTKLVLYPDPPHTWARLIHVGPYTILVRW